jgi:hypothetical protein
MNLSLLAANVSPQVRIVSTNLSPRQLMFASQANDVCKPQQILGRVGATHRCVTPPSEPGERVAPHPAQATGREFKVSDSTPADWCSRVTFTRAGIQLFPWMSPLLLVLSTRHPATSAPFQVGYHPIRRVMAFPCLSAAGLRFLAVLSHWSISTTLRCAYCPRQTPLGFPRSA